MTYRIGRIEQDSRPVLIVELQGGVYRLADLTNRQAASVLELIDDWPSWHDVLASAVPAAHLHAVDTALVRWLTPIENPPKLICIGINYHDHIAEMGVSIPNFPYSFMRPATSLSGHGQAIEFPAGPEMIDWEAELGVVVGRRVRNVAGADALAAVGFYTVINDLSARDWIESRPFVGVDWVMQKAWDGFQPTGPWLTPACFVPDPQSLSIELSVNGIIKQRSNTAAMVFGVREIIEHLSRIMTLEPGDLIATGTPAGVGYGRSPREFLGAGDVIEITVGSLGTLRSRMVLSKQ